MEITEVRIKLMEDPTDRLCAFCSITLDDSFVVRDLKIIQGAKGVFVAMPSRKLSDRCPKCHCKNQIRASFCNNCGVKLHPERALKDDDGRAKLYADIAHPINSVCREMIQKQVIKSFEEELVHAKQTGYSCTYDDYEEERFAELNDSNSETGQRATTATEKQIAEQQTPSAKEETSQENSNAPSITKASPSTLSLETENGKLLRIDPHSSHNKCESNHSEKREQEVTPQKSPSDPFGDGII